jgi:hypothetical protein
MEFGVNIGPGGVGPQLWKRFGMLREHELKLRDLARPRPHIGSMSLIASGWLVFQQLLPAAAAGFNNNESSSKFSPVVLDARFKAEFPLDAKLLALTATPAGNILASYSRESGAAPPILVRLGRDGSLDREFKPAVTNQPVHALAVLEDGRILCGTGLSSAPSLVRLFPDGSQDPTAQTTWQTGCPCKPSLPTAGRLPLT